MAESSPHFSSFAPYCDKCPLRLTSVADPDRGAQRTGGWLPCECQYHVQCSRCGWPITDDIAHSDRQNLCAVCEREELTRGRPPEDRHELPALLSALGLPPNVPVTFHLRLGTELDDAWGDYRVEWAVIPDVAWRYAATDFIIYHPWRVQLPGENDLRVILRSRQWRVDAPEFLERSWRRDGSRWIHEWQVRAIDGLPSPRRVREFAQLLQGHKAPGRPRDDAESWLQDKLIPEIVATITGGQDPDQRTLAGRMGLSLQGLQKTLLRLNQQRRGSKRKPLLWKRLVADIQAGLWSDLGGS